MLNNGIYEPLNTNATTTNANIALLNPFRYRGYYYDIETGLYYLNSRYYDPELGRFINADDISILNQGKDFINGLNLYAYCFNNPINDTDDNGNWSWKSFWKAVTTVVIAVVVVTVVTAACVATVGGAAVALGASAATVANFATATAVGGLVAGGMSIIGQGITNGFENINLGTVAIDTFGGAIFGTITAGVGNIGTFTAKIAGGIGKIALAGVTTALHGINEGLSIDKIGKNMLWSMGVTAVVQGIFIGGPQLLHNPSKQSSFFTPIISLFNKINNNSNLKVLLVNTITGIYNKITNGSI